MEVEFTMQRLRKDLGDCLCLRGRKKWKSQWTKGAEGKEKMRARTSSALSA